MMRADRAGLWVVGVMLCGAAALAGCDGCGGSEPNAENAPPTLVINPEPEGSEYTFTPDDVIDIEVLARDEDEDQLVFDYEADVGGNENSTLEGSAMWLVDDNRATFRWSPDSADITLESGPIELIFIVQDTRGGYVDRKVLLNILPGNGTPRFESSGSVLYQNCCDKPLSFEVRVRDEDAEPGELALTMTESPQGADFNPTGDKKGRFTWRPTEQQAKRRVHLANFRVEDANAQSDELQVSIIIPQEGLGPGGPQPRPGPVDPNPDPEDPEAGLCDGEELISHEPLGAQREVLQEFVIEAIVDPEAVARYDDFVIFWSQLDPVANPDATLSSNPMSLDETNGQLLGSIPNQALRDDTSLTLFYKICMIDVDAPEDDPASFLCAPTLTDLFYSFNVYLDSAEMCQEDALDETFMNDDFANAQEVARGNWSPYKLCSGNPDYHAVRVRPGATIGALLTYPQGAEFDLTLYGDDQQPLEEEEPIDELGCTGLTFIELSTPVGGSGPDVLSSSSRATSSTITCAPSSSRAGRGARTLSSSPTIWPSRPLRSTLGAPMSDLQICPSGEDLDVYAVELEAGPEARRDAAL